MDPKTKAVLARISQNVPDNLKDNLTMVVIDTSEEDIARAALEADFISKKKKKKIRDYLNAGRFRREERVLNEEVVKKIDEYYEQEIKKAIESGEIPDPKDDPFIKARRERMEKIAEAKLLTNISGEPMPKKVPSSLLKPENHENNH